MHLFNVRARLVGRSSELHVSGADGHHLNDPGQSRRHCYKGREMGQEAVPRRTAYRIVRQADCSGVVVVPQANRQSDATPRCVGTLKQKPL